MNPLDIGNISFHNLPFVKDNELVSRDGAKINSFHVRFSKCDAKQYFGNIFYWNCVTNIYYAPCINLCDFDQVKEQLTYNSIKWWATLDQKQLPEQYNIWMPIKYRIYPWSNKNQLKEELIVLINK